MQDRHAWRALRICDAQVEVLIADGAYEAALDQLVRGYQRVMVSFCRTQLGPVGQDGRAEEVAQEVFLAAYRGMPRFTRRAPLHTWLFAIARKRCLQEQRNWRRRSRGLEMHRATVAAAVHMEEALPDEERLMSAEELAHLRASLGQLRKWERELLLKRFFEGYTINMLARESTFWSESTMRNRLTQALQHLRTLYYRHAEPPGG